MVVDKGVVQTVGVVMDGFFMVVMRILLSFLQTVQIEWELYQQAPVEPAFYFGHTCGIVHGLSARGLHTLLPPVDQF